MNNGGGSSRRGNGSPPKRNGSTSKNNRKNKAWYVRRRAILVTVLLLAVLGMGSVYLYNQIRATDDILSEPYKRYNNEMKAFNQYCRRGGFWNSPFTLGTWAPKYAPKPNAPASARCNNLPRAPGEVRTRDHIFQILIALKWVILGWLLLLGFTFITIGRQRWALANVQQAQANRTRAETLAIIQVNKQKIRILDQIRLLADKQLTICLNNLEAGGNLQQQMNEIELDPEISNSNRESRIKSVQKRLDRIEDRTVDSCNKLVLIAQQQAASIQSFTSEEAQAWKNASQKRLLDAQQHVAAALAQAEQAIPNGKAAVKKAVKAAQNAAKKTATIGAKAAGRSVLTWATGGLSETVRPAMKLLGSGRPCPAQAPCPARASGNGAPGAPVSHAGKKPAKTPASKPRPRTAGNGGGNGGNGGAAGPWAKSPPPTQKNITAAVADLRNTPGAFEFLNTVSSRTNGVRRAHAQFRGKILKAVLTLVKARFPNQ